MTDLSIQFQNVSFTYDQGDPTLDPNLSVHFTRGWTGIVGANRRYWQWTSRPIISMLKHRICYLTALSPLVGLECWSATTENSWMIHVINVSLSQPPDAILRPGNYSHGLQQPEKDKMTVQKQRTQAKHDFSRLKREAVKRRDAASQAHRKRSKGTGTKDHDARGKIDLAHVSGKDGTDGKRLNQLGGRLSQTRIKMDSIKVKKT